MWLWTLLACTPELPQSISDCADLSCRSAWVAERWPSDPLIVTAEIAQTADPIEQLALTTSVVERYPGQTNALCQALRRGPAAARCQQLNSRPHLWEPVLPTPSATGRAATGPASLHVAPVGTTSPLSSSAPAEDPCTDDRGAKPPAHTACISRAAQRAAGDGRAPAATSLCNHIDEARWRGECMFQAAEAGLRRVHLARADRYTQAADLCLGAGDFRTFCLAHVHVELARGGPSSDTADVADWADSVALGDHIQSHWTQRGDPAYGEIAASHYWSESVAAAFTLSAQVTGDLLPVLPPIALPHVHASAAARALTLNPQLSTLSLSDAVTVVRAALAQRSASPSPPPAMRPVRPSGDLWPVDRDAADAAIPATWYRGISRRGTSDDVDADIAICLLEAQARTATGAGSWAAEAANHANPVVRWTGARLAARNPELDRAGPGQPELSPSTTEARPARR